MMGRYRFVGNCFVNFTDSMLMEMLIVDGDVDEDTNCISFETLSGGLW